METIKTIITIIIGFAILLAVGYWTNKKCQAYQNTSNEKRTTSDEIPSIAEFQEMLNRLDPRNPIKVDGKFGPETQAKWDRVYCNQCAAKYMSE